MTPLRRSEVVFPELEPPEYTRHAGRKSLGLLVSMLLSVATIIGIGALILWSI